LDTELRLLTLNSRPSTLPSRTSLRGLSSSPLPAWLAPPSRPLTARANPG